MNNSAASSASIIGVTRRAALCGLGAATTGIAPIAQAVDPVVTTPEQFGAIGDGVAPDGMALARMIEAINATAGRGRVEVVCRGRYLMRGAPRRAPAPTHRQDKGGAVFGLPPITRDNVLITAWGAEFVVPPEVPFRRLERGGGESDSFFVGLQFLGRGIQMLGGLLDGNLNNRPASRGPRPLGYGGDEYALVMEGEDWLLDRVSARDWGTDCLLIGSTGRSHGGTYTGARRNCVSVVATTPISPERPVVIEGGVMRDAADWPDWLYNNPGAGIDVEGTAAASVILRGIDFSGNRLKDVQISKEAHDCVVEYCTIRNRLLLRPLQRGGHVIRHNVFDGEAPFVRISETFADNKNILIEDNTCVNDGSLIVFHGSRVPEAVARQRIVLSVNRGCQ